MTSNNSETENKEFNVGDSVYWAKAETRLVHKPCPVCFGKRRVTVILGNDEQVSVECDYCGKGWENARGYVESYDWVPGVQQITLDKKTVEEVNGERNVEYRYGGYVLRDEDIFSTTTEANDRIKEKIIERDRAEAEKIERTKDDKTKSFGWLVGYHRREKKRAEQQVEYHGKKVISMGKLARKPKVKAGEEA